MSEEIKTNERWSEVLAYLIVDCFNAVEAFREVLKNPTTQHSPLVMAARELLYGDMPEGMKEESFTSVMLLILIMATTTRGDPAERIAIRLKMLSDYCQKEKDTTTVPGSPLLH